MAPAADDGSGHLDCMFDCGRKFSSLEAIYLHIELDHREDNSVSPFAAVERSPSFPQPYHEQGSGQRPPPLPTPTARGVVSRQDSPAFEYAHSGVTVSEPTSRRRTRPTPNGNGQGNREADEAFVLCPEKACGELILVADLNDHLDLHDAQLASLDEDYTSSSSLPQSDSDGRRSNGHSSSSLSSHFSTDIDPALRPKPDLAGSSLPVPPPTTTTATAMANSKMEHDEASRAHIGRKFLSMFSNDKRTKDRVPSNKAPLNTQRLGTAELGPHAYENRMPGWMYKKLKDGPKITRTRRLARNGSLITHESVDGQTNGVLPILRQLIELDSSVYRAYLCHPSVTQVGKRSWEAGFCGFHNTQMVISYIQNSQHPAHTLFPGHIPGILDIQDWIEDAWSEGINDHAKSEFGGLRGTRKWIGTLEVDTLFQYLGIPHRIHQFHDSIEVNNQYADQNLLDWVESYFRDAAVDDGSKVKCTLKPPIYFQRPGHSLTIVGIERMRNGARNLLVFDPMYQVPTSMLQLIERGRVRDTNSKLLRFYRRSQQRLYHYADFEATTLEGELPLFPAWDVLSGHDDDVFATITDWQWEIWPLDYFNPAFPWPFYGTVFRIKDARFERALSFHMSMLPGGLCVPQLWFRNGNVETPLYEKWLLHGYGQHKPEL